MVQWESWIAYTVHEIQRLCYIYSGFYCRLLFASLHRAYMYKAPCKKQKTKNLYLLPMPGENIHSRHSQTAATSDSCCLWFDANTKSRGNIGFKNSEKLSYRFNGDVFNTMFPDSELVQMFWSDSMGLAPYIIRALPKKVNLQFMGHLTLQNLYLHITVYLFIY